MIELNEPNWGDNMDPFGDTGTILIVIALILGGVRFFIPGQPLTWLGAYKDFAHLFVGGLIGAGIAKRSYFLLSIAGLLTVVEVVISLMMR